MKPMQRKLGRKILPQDKRALWLFDYFDRPRLKPAPPTCRNSDAVTVPLGMMANDEYGDCVFAAAGHGEMVWTANAGNIYVPPDADILSAYSAVTGFDPNDPSTDNGTDPLAALKYWRNTGISGRKIGAWAQVNAKRPEQLRQCIYLFEFCFMSLALPAALQVATIWDIPAGQRLGDDWKPGSWGGHEVAGVDYDEQGVWVITWGQRLLATWAFLAAYCDLPIAVLSQDELNGSGVAPNGLHLDDLNAALRTVRRI